MGHDPDSSRPDGDSLVGTLDTGACTAVAGRMEDDAMTDQNQQTPDGGQEPPDADHLIGDPQHKKPDTHPWWRLIKRGRHWLAVKTVERPVVAGFIIAMVIGWLPMLMGSAYAGSCFVDYLREQHSAIVAREEPRAKVEEARRLFDDVNRRILDQTATSEDYDLARVRASDLDRLEDELREARESNPLPNFPTDLCGLIPIAPEEEPHDNPESSTTGLGRAGDALDYRRPAVGGYRPSRCGRNPELRDTRGVRRHRAIHAHMACG